MDKKKIDEGKFVLNGETQPMCVHIQTSSGIQMCTDAHMHDYIEMLYCTDGNYVIWLNGNQYTFSKGDLVVINSREVHTVYSLSETGGKYICARFLPEILYISTVSSFDVKYVLPFILNNSNHQRVFRSSEISDTFIPSLMHEMLDEYNNQAYGYELAVKNDISRIFLWIVRYWNSLNVDISAPNISGEDMIDRMKMALDFISVNYSDDIKASEVADMCNLSYSYFSRIFKQYMKKSFSEYLNYIRLSNAEKLLASTDMPITEIASKCGFATSSYFIKQFREHKNISPKQFRKMFMK